MVRTRLWLTLLALSGCGVDGFSFGVSGCEGQPGRPFAATPDNTVEHGLRATVTAAGTQFLIDQREVLAGLLFDVLPNGHVQLPVPAFDFGANGDGLGVGIRDVVLDFDLRAVDLQIGFLNEPARIHVAISGARLALTDGIVWVSAGGNAACRLRNGLDPGTPDAALVDADLAFDIGLTVDALGNFQAQVSVLPFTIHGLDFVLAEDPTLPECNDGISDTECPLFCSVGDFGTELLEAVYTNLRERLDRVFQPAVQALVDALLGPFNGKPLYVEGEVHPRVLSTLIPTASDAHPLGFRSGPSAEGFQVRSFGNEGDGVDLTLDVGLDAVDHPCVPPVDALPAFLAGEPPILSGFDFRGQPYHLGTSLSQAVVNRALWTAYRAGVLCLALDSDQIEGLLGQQVTTDTLALVLPGLKELAGGPRPVLIALDPRFRPDDFPLVRFHGVPDSGGLPQAGMALNLPRLGLSFYAFIEERWTRLFSVTASVMLEVAVSATPENKLALAAGQPNVTDVRVEYNELLEAAALPELVDLVVNLLTSALLRDGLELDVGLSGLISQITGLPLDARIAALRTEGTSEDYLSVLLSLTGVAPGAALRASVETEAAVLAAVEGRVSLAVAAPGAREARYQWRVDRGPWRPWVPASEGQLEVIDSLLKTLGEHRVEVRAVDAADYRSADPTPAAVTVETALSAPQPARSADGGCSTSPAGESGPGGWLALAALGLLWRTRRARLVALGGILAGMVACEDKKPAARAECIDSSECPGGLVCTGGLCQSTPACQSTADCCPGSECSAGRCIALAPECETTADCGDPDRACGESGLCQRATCAVEGAACPGGGACLAGHCHVDPPCGARCTADEACFAHLDVCGALPPGCTESCPAGFSRVVETPEDFLGPTCDVSAATCGCVRSPPIRPADFGRHASMAMLRNQAVFAAYDADFGDLVFVEGTEGEGTPRVTYLDGVPEDAAVVADPSGARGGRAGPGPDRGRYASLAVDAKSRPQIAYYDADAGDLRFIRGRPEGGFEAAMVLDEAGDVGRYAQLRLDARGRVHVAYFAARLPDGGSGLRYAVSSTPEPTSAADFTLRTVAARAPLAGQAEPAAPGEIPKGLGVMPCMRLGPDGYAYVGFYDGETGRMSLGRGDAGGFATFELSGTRAEDWPADPGGRYARFEEHDRGRFCDLVVFDDVTVGVSFLDADTQALVYYRGPVEGGGTFELIDQGGRGVRRFVGADSALALDETGRAVLVYQDQTDNDLLLVARNPEGWFDDPFVVATAGALGFYNSLVMAGGEAVIGTLELKTLPGGRGAHRLHVFRQPVPNF